MKAKHFPDAFYQAIQVFLLFWSGKAVRNIRRALVPLLPPFIFSSSPVSITVFSTPIRFKSAVPFTVCFHFICNQNTKPAYWPSTQHKPVYQLYRKNYRNIFFVHQFNIASKDFFPSNFYTDSVTRNFLIIFDELWSISFPYAAKIDFIIGWFGKTLCICCTFNTCSLSNHFPAKYQLLNTPLVSVPVLSKNNDTNTDKSFQVVTSFYKNSMFEAADSPKKVNGIK